MPAPTQESRPFAVSSPLGPDVLLLLRMTGSETLGRLFTYELDLLSSDHSIAIADVLGQHLTVRAKVRQGGTRYFDGVVSRFSYVGSYGQYARYTATLRPWLWFLTRAADCRIFQGDTTVDIMKKIFGEHGFSDLDLTRIATPPVREYCTQYRETDFNFISRLLEHDGIYYYFLHEDGKHKLVLADGAGCHDTVSGYETIPFSKEGSSASPDDDRFLDWSLTQEVQTGVFAHTDYDFKKPKAPLETKGVVSREHAQAAMEVFDYPGYYIETGVGETIARTRIEELQTQYEFGHGGGTVRGLGAGALFALAGHPRADLNKNYLVVSATFEIVNPEYETGMGSTEPVFTSHVTAIDDKTQYRSPRVTRKPTVQGPQTATITGQGSDVWTDEYGRVKVHFHWDRKGPTDETSSCWLRVSQNWAGKNWGGMFLPHIGQEVIVDFLEGDPDLPIVTGRVYNQDNMPPLALPTNKLKSIIRDNFGNQIIFDATPGKEHIQLFSPHHQSALELGRSLRMKSEDDYHVTKKKDFFEAVVGLTTQLYLGGKATAQVGFSFDLFVGFKAGIHLGNKVDVHKGSGYSYFSGGKYENSKGFKYIRSAQKEYRLSGDDFTRRSEGKITLDTRNNLVLNAGPADNSLIRMTNGYIALDFGQDNAASGPAVAADGAAKAQEAVSLATIAWLGGAALLTGASVGIDNMFQKDSDSVSLDQSVLLPTISAGIFGTMLVGPVGAVAEESLVAASAVKAGESAVEKSKSKQDNTYSRVFLFKDGVKIQVFADGRPKATSQDAEIIVKKTGEILITSKKKGVTIDTQEKITIKSAADIALEATGDVTIDGKNIKLTAKSSITTSPKLSDC